MKTVIKRIPAMLLAVIMVCVSIFSLHSVPKTYAETSNGTGALDPVTVVSRYYGANRYETSIRVADALKDQLGVDNFDTIILASGANYADALAGSYLSCQRKAPVLLVDSKQSHINAVQKYIEDNLSSDGIIYVLGGTQAVPDKAVKGIQGRTVKRLWGQNRYETNLAILKEARISGNEILVVSGTGFADSLSAAATGKPILLVGQSLKASQKKYLKADCAGKTFRIIGGPAAVSDAVMEELQAYGSTSRIGGSNRYETTVNVARTFFGGAKACILTYAKNFPDGLSGASLANAIGGPLLLVADGKTQYAEAYAHENDIHSGAVLGGPTLISDESVEKVFGRKPMEALNILGSGAEDMIWSWWNHPQVVSNEAGDVFWGYLTKEGYCGVAKYDAAAQSVTRNALMQTGVDDHNGLALTILDDGRIMAVYAGGHDTDHAIYVCISDASSDITNFHIQAILRSSGTTCYSQIIRSSGKYYLFYRVNGNAWAYRYSVDLTEWSAETIAVTAPMEYNCRFTPTTQDNVIRMLMTSDPSATAPEIRLGFFDTADNSIYNGSAFSSGTASPSASEKLSPSNNPYTSFMTLLQAPDGKTMQLLDSAVTEPGRTEFLYAEFSATTGANDSVYYVYDSGASYEILRGGKALMDYEYQLGASFVSPSSIVAARNVNGTDLVEQYSFDGKTVSFEKALDSQVGTARSRNARPITDRNGRAILWHNGYYNNTGYTDFDTSSRLYLPGSDLIVLKKTGGETVAEKHSAYTADDPETPDHVQKVLDYADKLYDENKNEDYRHAEFTWSQEHHKRGWLYYSGLMIEAFLETDPEKYSPEILEYYDDHVILDNSAGKYIIWAYVDGELDWVLPATGMIDLIREGIASGERADRYRQAINYVYNMLEHQTMYEEAGRLWQHSERATQVEEDGQVVTKRVPVNSWAKWNICLDGVYMSNLFLTRLAEAMDAGLIEIYSEDGSKVDPGDLWNDIYSRMSFVMENFRNPKTGLLWHGYCVDSKECNGVTWSRGLGWFTMALMDAAEKMPDASKQAALKNYFNSLMASIIEWQDPESGLWYNVVDRNADLYKNQPETSGSSMFAYCMLKGYHNGLLNGEEFRNSGLIAFNAMARTKLTEEGLTDTLIGMGCSAVPEHYQNNRFVTNEAKGVGPFIMAADYAY